MGMVVDTIRDLDSGVTTVWVAGELTFATAPAVRSALAKGACECPAAVIVDLSALEVASPALLVLFVTASRRATAQWDVPMVFCSDQPDVGRSIKAFRPFSEVFDSVGAAVRALPGWAPRWRRQQFPPLPASAASARDLVARACHDWHLSTLLDRGVRIVSELADNAIEHAGTDFDVTVSYSKTYLRIAVRDGGPALLPWSVRTAIPSAPGDRKSGLHLVDGAATAWNVTDLSGGKIVWAFLRVRPLTAPQGRDDTGLEPPSLTERELEVLDYLPTLLTSEDIAAHLHVSSNTVKAHMRSIYVKLDVTRRQDAVSRAHEWDLLP
jgi:DNA-binding CsgD family transcriptional regulator/anti-anti-sigma regulatory factor/anti-sigma regulatory factor (Ser/Thr protein kinase)